MEQSSNVLFVISSPFQAICALEAIYEFEIRSYVFLVLITRDDRRKEQICFFLDSNSVSYKIIFIERIGLPKVIGTYFYLNKQVNIHFKHIFLGDYFDLRHLFTSIALSQIKSKIIFLDDGSSSINIFTNINPYGLIYTLKRKLLLIILYMKKCQYNTFFSIFNKISINTPNIIPNKLRFFKKNVHNFRSQTVCIIGTYVDEYCAFYGISIERFITCFRDLLISLKTEYIDIIYSPHGRCNNIEIIKTCKEFNVEIKYSKVSVEFDYLHDRIYPRLVIAFDSTAIYTLKSIFTDCEFINIQFMMNDGRINKFAEKNAIYLYNNFKIITRRY